MLLLSLMSHRLFDFHPLAVEKNRNGNPLSKSPNIHSLDSRSVYSNCNQVGLRVVTAASCHKKACSLTYISLRVVTGAREYKLRVNLLAIRTGYVRTVYGVRRHKR